MNRPKSFRYLSAALVTLTIFGIASRLRSERSVDDPGSCYETGRAPANSEAETAVSYQGIAVAALDFLEMIGNKSSPRSNCSPEATVQEQVAKSDLQLFWRTQQCEDILSERGPRGTSFDMNEWWPVCSSTLGYYQRKAQPSLSAPNLYQSILQTVKNGDLCRHGETRMRSGSNYEAPSRAQQKVELLSLAERQSIEEKLEGLKTKAEDLCCDSKQYVCKKMFHATQFKWCKPETDPNKPDTCIGTPSFYLSTTWYTPGTIVLSPLKGVNGKGLSETWATLSHELGHACSAVRQTTSNLYQAFGCKISKRDQNTYHSLFSRFAASDETVKCVQDEAERAIQTRFEPFETCQNGCPLSQMEEALADYFAVQLLPGPKLAADLLPRFCSSHRDNDHAFRADEVRCFLRTPAVKQKIQKALQCIF